MGPELKTMTRGGQTLLHALRMLLEVARVILLWSLLAGVLVGFFYFTHHTTKEDRIHLIIKD